jgi:hypothetical protein
MRTEDRKTFTEIMIGFAELKGKTLSAAAITLLWNAMQDWSIAELQQAANRLLKTCKFMPGPTDFEELRKTATQRNGAEIWDDVRQYLKYQPNGFTLDPNTPRAIAAAIMACGGANAIAMCNESELHWMRERFCRHYDQLTDRGDTRASVPALTQSFGLLEHDDDE